MKQFKHLVAILLCLMMTATVAFAAYPEPTGDYAADFAGVLNDQQRSYINNASRDLDEKTKAQVIMVTVNSLDGEDIDSYSLNLARKWGIGDKEKSNGVLILFAPSERKIKVEVGYGLEGALNDGKVGRLLDLYAMEYLRNDDFEAGLMNLYNAILPEVYQEYNLEVPEDLGKAEQVEEEGGSGMPIVFGGIGFIVLMIIISIFNRKGGGRGPRPPFYGGFYGGGFHGGGFGGGSSGGFGGGGGFSGGGGGFGGGGAGRSF